ncbi:MAG: polysaccharide biosynthesis protein [Candidatus Limiplasma sp.]|nr:polysaccharide biosynthesis protein [Candidatus Limiplasma sp.]
MSDRQKSIVGGMTVLGITGLICKVIAVLYRIPLAWLIGEQGIGTFQLVFPTYNLLLTLSSAGLPVAISRMVSYSLAQNDPRNAHRTFRNALSVLTLLGALGTLLMIVFNPFLSDRVGDPETQMGFVAIAPALVIVCTMSAFRGLMQGQQNMNPTAMSQLIEQISKVLISLPLAYVGSRVGMTDPQKINIGYAAAGALLGNSIGEACALFYMTIIYRKNKPVLLRHPQDETIPPINRGQMLKRLFSLAIPITLAACIVPLASFIDSGMVVNNLIYSAGFAREEARAMYGRYSGYVINLINVPTALAQAISMSLVPAVSAGMARKDWKTVRMQSHTGLRMAFLIGLPCSVGMSMLSREILTMIYSFPTREALNQTAELLSMSSYTIVLFTVVQASSGILQGLRKQRIPMYTLLLGVALKILMNYNLIGIREINIYGAPMGSLICYLVSMLPNLYYVHKYARLPYDPVRIFFKPLGATACMGAVLWLFKRLLPASRGITLLLILLGVVAYAAFGLLLGALNQADLKPFLRRMHRRRVGPGRTK